MSASAATTVITAAQKAQNFATQTAQVARTEVLKEPLGFIKILQFFLALLAFATAASGGSELSFNKRCMMNEPNIVLYKGIYNYPYDLKNAPLKPVKEECPKHNIDRNTISTDSKNIVSSAQFFVFTGVTAFLYSIAFSIIYIFFRHKYINVVYLPLIDFGATCMLTIFWFAGTIAWSKAVSDIQYYTKKETLFESLSFCQNDCIGYKSPTYPNLIVSCILGYGNLILWTGNVWFVIKETSWYKLRHPMNQQSTITSNNPISTNDINISAHYNPNDKI